MCGQRVTTLGNSRAEELELSQLTSCFPMWHLSHLFRSSVYDWEWTELHPLLLIATELNCLWGFFAFPLFSTYLTDPRTFWSAQAHLWHFFLMHWDSGLVCLCTVATALIVGQIPEEFFPKIVFMGCVSYEMQHRMGLYYIWDYCHEKALSWQS